MESSIPDTCVAEVHRLGESPWRSKAWLDYHCGHFDLVKSDHPALPLLYIRTIASWWNKEKLVLFMAFCLFFCSWVVSSFLKDSENKNGSGVWVLGSSQDWVCKLE
jgi:hypothetical protein